MAYGIKEITGSVIYIGKDNVAKVICAVADTSYTDKLLDAFKFNTKLRDTVKPKKEEFTFFLPEYIRDKVKVGCTYKFTLMYNIDTPERSTATEVEQII